MDRPLKVYMFCTGVGIFNRGIESFFRECFDGLHPEAESHGIKLELFKGAGPELPDEHRVWCVKRTSRAASAIGAIVRRNGYTVEQMTSLLPLIRRIRSGRPDLIFTSEINVSMRLFPWRKKIGVPYRIIYSNGAPMNAPFPWADHVQQIVPFYLNEALAAGDPKAKFSLVPYGIRVPAGDPLIDPQAKRELRKRLNLPLDRKIIISVGWIARALKRMDYTIEEIASLPPPRPFFLMLGAMDEQSPPILKLAKEKLGEENFTARSVPYEQVPPYYEAADIFALGSLKEGFGRVYLESLMHGLPTLANDHPVMRYVLGEQGTFGDLSRAGGMAARLSELLAIRETAEAAIRRRQSVRQRFSWEALAPAYAQMFRDAMNQPAALAAPPVPR